MMARMTPHTPMMPNRPTVTCAARGSVLSCDFLLNTNLVRLSYRHKLNNSVGPGLYRPYFSHLSAKKALKIRSIAPIRLLNPRNPRKPERGNHETHTVCTLFLGFVWE